MRTLLLTLMFAFGCLSPSVTSCPNVDCPKNKVCDGQGGCALPEQLGACMMASSGDACSYTDATGATISGVCAMGVCLPVGCGNGVVTPPEVCDDGNNVSGD